MRIVNRDQIIIESKRQRSSVPARHISDLRESIHMLGLMHPPVVVQVGEQPIETSPGRGVSAPVFRLIAGFCRLSAIDKIAEENTFFYCNKQVITPGEVPVLELNETLSPSEIKNAELEENIRREELPWQDRIQALAEIHALRVSAVPGSTLARTADGLAASGGVLSADGKVITAPHHIAEKLREATILAQHLHKPEISKARNATEAYHLVMAAEEKAFAAELIKRNPQSATSSSNDCSVRFGSLISILPTIESGIVDLVLADPPYGIGADAGGFRSRTVHHHNYADDVATTKTLLQCILSEGFRVARPRANMFLFCDIDLFSWLKETALRAGWDPFRTPITWVKSDSEGLAPWGRSGFRRTTEWLFFATKGEKGLYHAPVDVLRVNRVGRHVREYGPEKPTGLLQELISCSTLDGDLVLDPCCGAGSTLVSARLLKRRSIGIESDERAFNMALVNSQRDLESTEVHTEESENVQPLESL
jgi:site-specific DNA-methyltransferase (adenine-specific)